MDPWHPEQENHKCYCLLCEPRKNQNTLLKDEIDPIKFNSHASRVTSIGFKGEQKRFILVAKQAKKDRGLRERKIYTLSVREER